MLNVHCAMKRASSETVRGHAHHAIRMNTKNSLLKKSAMSVIKQRAGSPQHTSMKITRNSSLLENIKMFCAASVMRRRYSEI